MINELVTYLLDIAKKHKAVNYVGYKRQINLNNQNNTPSFQFIIENDGLMEKQVVEGIITVRYNIDILGYVEKENTVLMVQDNALHIALDFMEYINNTYDYPIEIKDWSILSFSEYTDDNSAGVRVSLKLAIPNPINICEYRDNFIEKEEPILPELDLSGSDECTNTKFTEGKTELNLNPIRLK